MRVAARRIELAEPVKTAGDVGQIMLMRANLRMPQSVAAAVAGSQAVVNAAGIPFAARPPALPGRPCRGRARHRRGGRAPPARSAWSISPASAPTTAARKNRYIQSKVAAEDAIIARLRRRHHPAATAWCSAPTTRCSTAWPTIACKAPFVPLVGNGSAKVQPVFVGDVGKAVAAVLARPDTAKSVFELGGPRVYTYREIAALVLREIDRKKPIIGVPAGLMKVAGFFAQQIARLGLVPPLTADQVELMLHDNVVRPGAHGLARPRHPADRGRGHPADLSRPLPHRRPLQPARSGLTLRDSPVRVLLARDGWMPISRHNRDSLRFGPLTALLSIAVSNCSTK